MGSSRNSLPLLNETAMSCTSTSTSVRPASSNSSAIVSIVGRLGLGTINHCLLTFAGLRQLGLAPRGFILAQTRAEADPSTADNERVIAASSGVPCLGVLGFAARDDAHAWLRGGVRGLLGSLQREG